MHRFSTIAVALLIVLMAIPGAAQVRGKGRLQGQIVDKDTGKPVGGATITINIADGSTAPIVVKANDKGRWSALGMINGGWNVDIDAPGYQPARKGPVPVSEFQMSPSMKIELTAIVVKPPEPEAVAAPAGPTIPQEVIDAVNAGQDFLAQQKYTEAVTEFEKALPALPENMQLKQIAAQAYYKAGDLKKAVALLEIVTAADAANTGVAVLLTNLYLENNQLAEARARLATLPGDAITDPNVWVNIGILFINKEKPEEALTYFTRAVDMDMTQAASFYYRGLANLQLKKMKDAKADFQKAVSLAPDSSEGRDAAQMLASMK